LTRLKTVTLIHHLHSVGLLSILGIHGQGTPVLRLIMGVLPTRALVDATGWGAASGTDRLGNGVNTLQYVYVLRPVSLTTAVYRRARLGASYFMRWGAAHRCMEVWEEFLPHPPEHFLAYKQHPQSMRRNTLPMKRIDGALLMGHEYLACALV